jgi:hypothetical protein
MDVGKSFAFVFEDKDWIVKILIGAAILLIGILFSWLLLIPLILALALLGGYSLEITRRVIRGNPLVLPEWENWGALIVDGLKVMVIVIVYSLPAIAVGVCLGVPAGILESGGETAQAFGNLLNCVMSLLTFLWSIALLFVLPASIAFFADTGDLNDAFRFRQIIALLRNHMGTYLITLLMTWVAGLIGNLGSLLCGIGWFATFPYSLMVTGHLYGQAYLAARGAAAPAAAPDVA